MSDTPPMKVDAPLPSSGRDRTPELHSKREKRMRDEEDDDRSRSERRRRDERDRDHDHDGERDRSRDRDGDRRRRHHRSGEEETDRDRERRRRHDETDEEREERRRRRRERDDRHRDRSRESHRSHPRERERSERAGSALKDMSREEKEREREKRDREMQEERREAARMREDRFSQMDRDRDGDRRRFRDDRPPRPPADRGSLPPRPPMSPPRRRDSPSYEGQGRGAGPRGSPPPPPPPKDPVVQLLEEVDREQRSVFVSQIASRLTSQDLGDFFVDMLGPGSVRDARVVMDKGRRSKGIAYVELDSVELLNKALSLSGTIVMGIPISIKQTESERNREGQMEAAVAKLQSGEWEREERQRERQRPQRNHVPKFPPLSTGLSIPAGLDVDKNKHSSIPYHRLYLTGVAYSLAPDDIGQVFEAFGPIEFVDLHRDHNGQSKGTAYVQFQNLSSAQVALDAMDNFEIAGRPIRVTAVEDRSQGREMVEEPSYAPRMDHNARRDLMQKLARTEAPQTSAPRSQPTQQAPAQPTPFLLVGNMFNPDEETERNWDLDMAEDIKGEVESKYGPIRKIKVDKMSRGDVYMEFDGIPSATRAHQGLGGRFFGGRQLSTAYISEAIFKAHL